MYQGSLLRIYLGQMNTAASVLMSFASPAPQFAPVHVGSLYPGEFAVDPNELLKFLQGPTYEEVLSEVNLGNPNAIAVLHEYQPLREGTGDDSRHKNPLRNQEG